MISNVRGIAAQFGLEEKEKEEVMFLLFIPGTGFVLLLKTR